MKYAFSSNAFRRYSLDDTIKIISALGYEGIEIMADVPHAYPPLSFAEIRDLRSTLKRCGVAVSNINGFMLTAEGDIYHPSFIESDPAVRRRRVDHSLRIIELARQLECPTVSIEPGGPVDESAANNPHQVFREGLEEIGRAAKASGVRVLIEPEPGLLIENSTQFLDLFSELDRNTFGLNFDIGHFFCVGEDPSALIPGLQHLIFHYHLEDIAPSRIHNHLMLGCGAIDIKRVLRSIERTQYQGFVTVELYPYEHKAVEAARHSMQYLRELDLY